jgi:hemerythrin-like domain-containing protein
LAVLERAGYRLGSGQGVDETAMSGLVDLLRTFADKCHHGKEEEHLFPALVGKGVPLEGGPVGVLLVEHEEGRGYLKTLSTSGDPASRSAAALRYVNLLRQHIEKENEVLFPMADELLSLEEQGKLAKLYEQVEREVVGPGVHEQLMARLATLEAAIPA